MFNQVYFGVRGFRGFLEFMVILERVCFAMVGRLNCCARACFGMPSCLKRVFLIFTQNMIIL